MKTNQNIPLSLESTGDGPLDEILGGGLPAHSVVILAGEPGSGKTILTLQILFRAARAGKKCLYLTTLSEPAIKVIRYMQLFGFFDPSLIDRALVLEDLGSVVRHGPEAILSRLSEIIEKHQPEYVAIDSFRAMADLVDRDSFRPFVYDIATQTAGWGATTLLVGEYAAGDLSLRPEFGIADGILRLGAAKQELTSIREFEVLKMRGMNYVSGRHFLDISKNGISVYPRVRAPQDADGPSAQQHERLSTGVAGLDKLFSGGLPRFSNTVLHGATGTGKTVLGLHFLVEGARRGEPGTLFTLEESPNDIRALAAGLGWDLPEMEQKGLISISYTSPVELSTDRYLQAAREHVRKAGTRRAVLDSLTSMKLGVSSERRFKELVYSIAKHMRADGVSLYMMLETEQLLGATELSGGGVSFIADNLVQLRYVEADNHLDRAVSVLKSRGISHETHFRLLQIEPGGARLVDPVSGSNQAVLTSGTPKVGN